MGGRANVRSVRPRASGDPEHDPEKLADFSDKIMRQDKERSSPAMKERQSPSPRMRGDGGERHLPRAG